MLAEKEDIKDIDFSKCSREDFGIPGTLLNRVLLLDSSGQPLSTWNDIKMNAKDDVPGGFVVNCVCKSPKDTWATYEIAEMELFHPLRMARYAGRPAHFEENLRWNLGIIPQTSAEPALVREEDWSTRYAWKPLEIVDVGPVVVVTGEVYPVKPLGAYLVVDPNTETFTWKIIGVAALCPLAAQLNDIADLEKKLPGTLIALQAWLRVGECFGPEIKRKVLGLGAKVAGRDEAIHAIHEAHGWWRQRQSKQLLSLLVPMQPDLVPEVTAALEYEPLWRLYVADEETRMAIPLADPMSGSSGQEGGWGYPLEDCTLRGGVERKVQARKLRLSPGRVVLPSPSGETQMRISRPRLCLDVQHPLSQEENAPHSSGGVHTPMPTTPPVRHGWMEGPLSSTSVLSDVSSTSGDFEVSDSSNHSYKSARLHSNCESAVPAPGQYSPDTNSPLKTAGSKQLDF